MVEHIIPQKRNEKGQEKLNKGNNNKKIIPQNFTFCKKIKEG